MGCRIVRCDDQHQCEAVEREAPPVAGGEGVLNGNMRASEAKPSSGEAPRALLVEGVLNPDNGESIL
jgi:hypothetical protein